MPTVITSYDDIPMNKKVIIDFYADWCGPCKRIAPEFEKLAEKYTDVVFLKVNVDNSEKLSEFYSVSALPTFVLKTFYLPLLFLLL